MQISLSAQRSLGAAARPCGARPCAAALAVRRPRAAARPQQRRCRGPEPPAATPDAARAGAPAPAAAIPEPLVEEIMNPHPVLLKAGMPIKEAVHTMLDADISGAPVVDDSGNLVGVLTEKDLIWKGAGAPEDHFVIPPVFIGFAEATIWLRDNKAFEAEAHKILARTVSEAMAKGTIISVAPSTPMSEAARLMLHNDINLLPVTEGARVVGVLTRHDVLRGLYASQSPFL